jgi:geranylgeranyl reductase
MKNKYDIVIVGAGPAGLSAAKTLAEAGRDVIVFERKKVVGDKVCAGGLTKKDFVLCHIPENLIERKFEKVIFRTERKTKEIDFKLVTVDRKRLGLWQLNEARKVGAMVTLDSNVTDIGEKYISVGGREVGYNYLIGADGASSIVRKFLDVETDELVVAIQYEIPRRIKNMELFFDPTRFGLTYLWIFPLKDKCSIGIGIDIGRSNTLAKLKVEFQKWLEEENIDISNAKFESAPVNYDYEQFDFGNKFLIGDAGGFASPITLEGIYSALLSGKEVAKKILEPDYKTPNLKKWIKLRNSHELALRSFEINDNLTELMFDLLLTLSGSKYISKKLLKFFIG